ncbi:MAG: fatty acid hydroxylase, partial [Comamonadaceae bacterium]|nr:fatty acid hydroxylase [Comamonadaceae bacterium]
MSFEQFVLANEPLIRMGFFFGVFALVALWELASPRRVLKLSRKQRWTANLGIVLLNTLVVRLLFPMAAVGMAALGMEKGWGLLNNFDVPFWLAVPLAVVAMDFVIWLQHSTPRS